MSKLQAFLPDFEWHSQHGEFLCCIRRGLHYHKLCS